MECCSFAEIITIHYSVVSRCTHFISKEGGSLFGVECVKHINSFGKPINLFMSVLSGLCDLSVRESYSEFSKRMASKLELVCIHKKEIGGRGKYR